MSNLIRGEFYKLRKSKYFIGMILLSLVFGFFLMVQWDTDAERLQNVHQELMNGAYSIQYAFECSTAISFIFALFAGEFIANDFKNNNISKSFSYGYRRSKIILSKLLVFIIFCLFLELIYATILVIYISINHGFCEVLNLSTILYLTRVIIVGIMYNVATICIIFIIAIITKSYFCTIVSPVILLIIFSLAYSNIGSYVSQVFSYMPYIIGQRAIARFASKAEIIRSAISSLITFSITIGDRKSVV